MFRIAACQLPHVVADPARALRTVREFATRAADAGADLVCFPEAYLQGYDPNSRHVERYAVDLASDEFGELRSSLAGLGPTLVIGLIERSASEYFNSAVAIRGGTVLAHYRKRCLLDAEKEIFAAGTEPAVFVQSGLAIGINICADLNSAACIADTAAAGADVIACPCNNMMSRPVAQRWKLRHNRIRAGRARESGVWIVSSDVTGRRGAAISYGPSAIIDPAGTVVDQVPLMTAGIGMADIDSRVELVSAN